MTETPEIRNARPTAEGAGDFDDAKTIRDILDGAVDKFESLIEKYKAKIGWIVAARVRREDVEGVTHQAFVQAFKSLGSFGGRAAFEHWLSRVAVHCCHDYWRRKQRENARFVQPEGTANIQTWLDSVAAVNGAEDLDEIAAREETRAALEQALGGLDADERWLLEARYYEDMPLKDAAATLGWSLVKTKVKAMRARHKLRKAIDSLIKEDAK